MFRACLIGGHSFLVSFSADLHDVIEVVHCYYRRSRCACSYVDARSYCACSYVDAGSRCVCSYVDARSRCACSYVNAGSSCAYSYVDATCSFQ